MRFSLRSTTAIATAGLFAALPSATLADVTPQDVLSNMNAALTAIGGAPTAEVTEAGGKLIVADWTASWTLPMGAGSFAMDMGSLELTGNDDGTVSLGVTGPQQIGITWDIPEVGTGRVAMTFSVEGYTTTASGDPGDVSYEYSIDSYAVTFDELVIDGPMAEDVGAFEVAGEMAFSALAGTYRITEGDLVTLTSDGSIGGGGFDIEYTVEMPDEGTIRSVSTVEMGALGGTVEAALPAGGTSLLKLADALRDGMSIAYGYTSASQDSTQDTFLDGELIMGQTTTAGAVEGTVRLDASGLSGDGTAADYALTFNQPLLFPLPVKLSMAGVEMDLAIPLLKSDDLQDGVLKVVLSGLTIDPELWALFDPGAALPRDPADVVMDVSGKVRMLYDLPDLESLIALDQSGDMPLEIHTLDVAEVSVAAAGASAAVTGGFTFDNTDMETFDGIPAPDGSATVTLTGVDRLLQTLVEMGLMSEGDMTGANMFLGGFTRPGEGAEERVTDIEVDGATGAVSANGQRLR